MILAMFLAAALPAFDHAKHLSFKAACLDCHGGVLTSIDAGDSLLPVVENCAGCHPKQTVGGEDSELGKRIASWRQKQAKSKDLVFPHKHHLELGYGGTNSCNPCHAGVEKARTEKQSVPIPDMPSCAPCHNVSENSQECARCHKLHKELTLKPLDHDWGFMRGHRAKAATNREGCLKCHSESWCSDCHATLALKNGNAPRAAHHEEGYRTLHPLEARLDDRKCSRCHDNKECQDCHNTFRARINSGDHRDRFQEVHPKRMAEEYTAVLTYDQAIATGCRVCHSFAGYNSPGDGFKQDEWHGDHAAAARRNLQECLRCHAAEPDCTRCHAVPLNASPPAMGPDPMGQRPHDSEFMDSVNRGGGPAHNNNVACFSCHIRADLCQRCHLPR